LEGKEELLKFASLKSIITAMEYVIVKIGGSQYQVTAGDELEVEKLNVKKGKTIEFDEVFLLVKKGKVKIGRPLVKGVKVKARVLDHFKGKKIRVATYKAKSRYRRVKGHRKHLTKIRIEKIGDTKRHEKGDTKHTKKETREKR
jgi:large subunit ribosomal protein L21